MRARPITWHPLTTRNGRRRKGLTLIEATMVLAVVTLIFGGFATLLNDASENLRVKNAVDRLKEVTKASEMYVSANSAKIRDKVDNTWTMIPTQGADIINGALPSIQAAGFLPPVFNDGNSYNQRHQLWIRTSDPADPTNTSKNARRIEAVVTTVASLAAGNRIPFRLVGKAANMMGAQGGFCRGVNEADNTCTFIVGAGGGWRLAASSIHARPGSIQASINNIDTGFVADYLNRNDIGSPEANTMRTTILSAATDKNGNPTYAMYQDPATGTTELKLGPDIKVDGYVKAGNYIQAGDCAPAGHPGFVYGCQNVEAGIDVNAGRNVNAADTFYGPRFVDTNDTSRLVDPSGRSNLKNINITDMLVTTDDANDRLNANQNVRLRDLLPRYVAKDGFSVSSAAPDVELPVCPNGGQQRIFLSPMQDSFAFDLGNHIKEQISNGYVFDTYNRAGPGYREAVTDVQCSSGGCNQTKDVFVHPDGLGELQAVTAINYGQIKGYRQFVASDPYPSGSKLYWRVDLKSPEYKDRNGNDIAPLPWRALAMTYCYY